MLMLNRVVKRCQTCLTKERSNPRNKRYLWIQVKQHAQNACARKTCLKKPSKRTKCCTMFHQMFDAVQILSNTTKHDPTTPTKVLKMFGHQTMFDRVWSPNISRLDRALGSSRMRSNHYWLLLLKFKTFLQWSVEFFDIFPNFTVPVTVPLHKILASTRY